MLSSEKGHRGVCELLIERGAKVDLADKYGKRALMFASENGHREVCRLLLERGAEVNVQDYNGWGALTYSACGGHERICELFLEAGAEVNAVDVHGSKAINYIMPNHEHIIETLVSYGSDFDCSGRNLDGSSIIRKLKQRKERILHLDYLSEKKARLLSLIKIIERKIIKKEGIREILENAKKKRINNNLSGNWKATIDQLVHIVRNNEGANLDEVAENDRIERLLIRNYFMKGMIDMGERFNNN